MDNPYSSRLKAAHDRLAGYLTELVPGAKHRLAEGTLLMPQAGGGYSGIWPDDSLYPLMALPSLANTEELQAIIQFLSDSVLELEYVPDRVEPDGLPILSPGPSDKPPMTYRMPLHLPAAWVRLLDYYQRFGVAIPQKRAWARLIERSVNCVPFANGLAYADPQKPPIGYGYHDTIKIAGWELMSSLVLMRGLERAVALFEGDIPDEVREHWTQLARGIRANLHRLYDANIGGYPAGSRIGRQFSSASGPTGLPIGWLRRKPKQRSSSSTATIKRRFSCAAVPARLPNRAGRATALATVTRTEASGRPAPAMCCRRWRSRIRALQFTSPRSWWKTYRRLTSPSGSGQMESRQARSVFWAACRCRY